MRHTTPGGASEAARFVPCAEGLERILLRMGGPMSIPDNSPWPADLLLRTWMSMHLCTMHALLTWPSLW